jgi:hypothetical protein
MMGWHSFGYFSFAIERKVTRRKGERHGQNLIALYMLNKGAPTKKATRRERRNSRYQFT